VSKQHTSPASLTNTYSIKFLDFPDRFSDRATEEDKKWYGVRTFKFELAKFEPEKLVYLKDLPRFESTTGEWVKAWADVCTPSNNAGTGENVKYCMYDRDVFVFASCHSLNQQAVSVCRLQRQRYWNAFLDFKFRIVVLVVHFISIRPPDLVSEVVLHLDLEVSRISTRDFSRYQIRIFELDDILWNPSSPDIIPADVCAVLASRVGDSEGFLPFYQIHCGRSEDLATVFVQRDRVEGGV